MSLLIEGVSEYNYYEITFHFGTGNYDDVLYVTGQIGGLGEPTAGDHGAHGGGDQVSLAE